jgi:hypothetical protein
MLSASIKGIASQTTIDMTTNAALHLNQFDREKFLLELQLISILSVEDLA